MLTATDIQNLMTRYLEMVTQGDIDGILALYDDNAVIEDPVGQPPHIGREAIDAFYRNGLGRMQVQAELQGTVRATDNGWGAMPFRVTVLTEPATCIDVIDVMEFDAEGRICSMQAYWSDVNVTKGV